MFISRVCTNLLVSLALLSAAVNGQADPGACSGDCWTHDPALVRRDDGVYFRFNTGSKIGILKSNSISGPWTFEGSAIPSGSSINLPGRDDLWVRMQSRLSDLSSLYLSRRRKSSRWETYIICITACRRSGHKTPPSGMPLHRHWKQGRGRTTEAPG